MSRATAVRWATILAAALVAALLVAAALADDGEDAPADPTLTALQPTQIVADIPEGYGRLFPLRWGGGSLYHLKGRLATMGCVANTLFLYDNDRWWAYNQYQVPQAHPTNQEFREAYEQFVPPTTLHADCYRICEFTQTRPESEWRWRYIEPNSRECLSYEYVRGKNFYVNEQRFGGAIDDETPCDDDFDPRVQERVLPVLPVVPEVCIVRQQDGGGGYRGLASFMTINGPPVVIVWESRNLYLYRTSEERDLASLHMEIHELCHINQAWQWIQHMAPDYRRTVYSFIYYFEDSPQGQEFRNLLGFEQFGSRWRVPTDSVYRVDGIYSPNFPMELSAELCAMYLLDMMGMRSVYDYQKFSGSGDGYLEVPVRRVDVNKYLTPEVRAWLEEWMILPQIDD